MAADIEESRRKLVSVIFQTLESDLRNKKLLDGEGIELMRIMLNQPNGIYLTRFMFNRTIVNHGRSKPLRRVLEAVDPEVAKVPPGKPTATTVLQFVSDIVKDGSGMASLSFTEHVYWGDIFYSVHLKFDLDIEKLLVVDIKENLESVSSQLFPIFIRCWNSGISQLKCECLTCSARRYSMRSWNVSV